MITSSFPVRVPFLWLFRVPGQWTQWVRVTQVQGLRYLQDTSDQAWTSPGLRVPCTPEGCRLLPLLPDQQGESGAALPPLHPHPLWGASSLTPPVGWCEKGCAGVLPGLSLLPPPTFCALYFLFKPPSRSTGPPGAGRWGEADLRHLAHPWDPGP